MPSKPTPRRPAPDAYDHLWLLLPVFVAFAAVIVFIAAPLSGY